MTPDKRLELEACLKRASEILYEDSAPESLETLEDIEKKVREQVLSEVSPRIALFFIEKKTGTTKGRKRKLKSLLGTLNLTTKQAERLRIEPYSRYSPLLEKCCLLLSANESYQDAERDVLLLTGVKVGHSTQHRKVKNRIGSPLDMKGKLSEIAVDGGTVRIRGEAGEKSFWKEYKTARLGGIYYGAFYQDNESLINWINSQKLTDPLYCLGDGHDGVWNIIAEISSPEKRVEILDWYHLMENLSKIEAKKDSLEQLKAYLWTGQVQAALNYLGEGKFLGGNQFQNYLLKHRSRIINYHYCQWQGICSLGSGAVESAVKQIGHRVKLTGAQWKKENVPRILQLRCDYLNGQLAF
jgi:hypothetical protein